MIAHDPPVRFVAISKENAALPRAAESPIEGLIDLAVADPDQPPPEDVVARAVAALRAGDSRYTEIAGRAPARRAVTDHHQRATGQQAGLDNVVLAPGAQGALYLAARCLAGPGDHLLTIEPHYLNYPPTLAATGAAVDAVYSDPDDDFRISEFALTAAVRPNTKAILLANPNNPTGRVLSVRDMDILTTVARRHNLWIVCDEVYRDLCTAQFSSLASRHSIEDRLVTLGSLSKSHAMTGWRCGWLIGPASLVAAATRLADIVYHGVPGFVQEAATRALSDQGAAALYAATLYQRRRTIFTDRLADSPIEVRPAHGGPFALCDVRRMGMSGAAFAEVALRQANVRLIDGAQFGRSTAGFVRIALTSAEATLREAAERLATLAALLGEARETPSPPQVPPDEPVFADGVYISSSGAVHVWRDGNLEAIF